jgi:hypothetical protein
VTSADPFTALASAAFRTWAVVAKSAMQASEATLRTLAEPVFKETDVALVNETELELKAPAGALLEGSPFVWIDDQTGDLSKEESAEHVIQPENVSFRPPNVPKPDPGESTSKVIVRLDPDHDVRTGWYVGKVIADGAVVGTAEVLVAGKDP